MIAWRVKTIWICVALNFLSKKELLICGVPRWMSEINR